VFEKLLSLLLHAKGGAVATVFVLGTTGALVTATVDAGVTTITITQPSSTTTGSQTTTPGGTTTTNTTVSETILALFNRTSAEEDPTPTATGNGCSDEAHRINELVKEINAEFKLAHQAVATLSKAASTDDAKKAAKDADKTLKDARREAVKEIHKTKDCPKGDDEDVDEDEDADEDEDEDTAATGTSVAFSGTDPEAIADLAISAMKQVVTDLTAKLAAQATTTNTTTTGDKAKPEGKSNKSDNKGKGNGKGRSGDDEDDD
jgi:hypothetical protein